VSGATKLSPMAGQTRTDAYGYGLLDVMTSLSLVSLNHAYSSPINTRSITRDLTSTYLRDELNTTCQTFITDAKCSVLAINPTTKQIITLADKASAEINLEWTSAEAGLTTGTWLIQTIVSTDSA